MASSLAAESRPATPVDPHALAFAFGPAPARKPWVFDLGICDDCGGLTEREHCPVCEPGPCVERRSQQQMQRELRRWRKEIDPVGEQARRDAFEERDAGRQHRRERIREQARLRPSWVVVRVAGEDTEPADPEHAVLNVPADVTESAKHVARAAAQMASMRLASDDSLDFALGRIALGRDDVRSVLADVFGIRLCRNTVAAALLELHERGVLPRAGRLGSWLDRKAEGTWPKKLGAYVYRLNVVFRELGQIAVSATSRVGRRGNATVRSTGYGPRLDGALSWAVEHAQIGTRNHTGHWLTCRCTDAGLDEGETLTVMELYRAAVPPGYGSGEVRATVRSRYRRLATA